MNKDYLHKRVLLKKDGGPVIDAYIHEMFDKHYFKYEILYNSEIVWDVFDLYEVVDTMEDYVHYPSKANDPEDFKIDWDKIVKKGNDDWKRYPGTIIWPDPSQPWTIPSQPYYPWQVWYTTVTSQSNNTSNKGEETYGSKNKPDIVFPEGLRKKKSE